jgi:hypothetical protein
MTWKSALPLLLLVACAAAPQADTNRDFATINSIVEDTTCTVDDVTHVRVRVVLP